MSSELPCYQLLSNFKMKMTSLILVLNARICYQLVLELVYSKCGSHS